MFNISEINEIITSDDFVADYNWIQQSLVDQKVDQKILFKDEIIERLDYFVNVVLSSCVDWCDHEGDDVCRIAGEISEVLSLNNSLHQTEKRKYRLRSAILYEFAELPSLSGSSLNEDDLNKLLFSFFKRRGPFQNLNGFNLEDEIDIDSKKLLVDKLIDLIFEQDAINLAQFEQGKSDLKANYSKSLTALAKSFSLGLNSSEISAFSKIIEKRMSYSTKSNTSEELYDKLRIIKFPSELWSAQIRALKNGLLDTKFDSWGLAAPTGTGKTFLTRLLIIDSLSNNPTKKILYLVPSRALVYEISSSLSNALKDLEIEVIAINPQLIKLDDVEQDEVNDSNVIVLTPEKADLLLRIGQSTIDEVNMVIIDEAHHIEADTRGVLLELYLWRVKRMLPRDSRFIFLSAVAPNIGALTNWMGKNPKSEMIEKRANRMRVGVFKF